MGTWSHKILGNDTTCEVRERFIELYNQNIDTDEIKAELLIEQKGNIECDPTNVWLGLALICWECKCLDNQLLNKVKKIVSSGEDIEFSIELDADEEFISKRKIELNKFVTKISEPKDKPRRRIKPPREYDFHIKEGEIYSVQIKSELKIKILIVYSKHFKNKGEIRYINLLDDNNGTITIPSIYYWPQNRKWSEFINGGSSYSIEYNNANREAFLNNLKFFNKNEIIPKLDFNRLTFSIRWDRIDFNNTDEFKNLLLARWKEDTNINYRATTVTELIEHIEMKPTHNNK